MATILSSQGEPIGQARGLNGGKLTVYNLKTGEASECHPVDARERIATGDWVYDMPGGSVDSEVIEADETITLDLSGKWPEAKKRLKDQLGIDSIPRAKADAVEMLKTMGYEVSE